MIVVYVFAALVLLRVVLIAVGAALIVREVHACPACFNESVPVQRPMLRFFLPWIEWRWCTYCGWEGPSKVDRFVREAGTRNQEPGTRDLGTRDLGAS